jgi:hypothetical protein
MQARNMTVDVAETSSANSIACKLRTPTGLQFSAILSDVVHAQWAPSNRMAQYCGSPTQPAFSKTCLVLIFEDSKMMGPIRG